MSVLNQLAKDCHAANQHWWHDPETGERLERNKGQLIMLIVSEIAEAMEGERKNLMDTHLTHRRMPEVELADALIRIFDYAGAFDYELDEYVNPHDSLNELAEDTRGWELSDNKGQALLEIVGAAISLYQMEDDDAFRPGVALADLICYIAGYAYKFGYDLDGAVAEKRAYNATRADHKPAARLAAGGKRW